MPLAGLRPFHLEESPAERRRRGLLYTATFCLLLLAMALRGLQEGTAAADPAFDLLPLIALLTGAMALVILRPSSRANRAGADAPDPRPSRRPLERLASFTEWRRSRSSLFRQYGILFPELDPPGRATPPPAKDAPGKNSAKKADAWTKVLEEFDNRNDRP